MSASPNTPILNKILEKLDSMDSRLTKLEEHVSKLDEHVSKLDEHVSILSSRIYSYIKTESDIQENQITELIRRDLALKYHYENISISPLRKFYIPGSNKEYTDLDGCILKKIKDTWPGNNNSVQRAAEHSRAYIIEAKHGLTKKLVDDKLQQFCKILDTFNYIWKNKANIIDSTKSNFDNMVLSYDLLDFPKNIIFIFASDDITDDVYNFIVSINEGKLQQDKYDEYLVKSAKESEVIKEILDNTTIPIMIKNKIKFAINPSDISTLFTQISLSPDAHPKDFKLETYKLSLKPYAERVSALFVSYKSIMDCYSMLKGKLGIYRLGKYYIDEDMFIPIQ